MQDRLRDRIITYLAQKRVGVLSAVESGVVRTIPVRYFNRGIEVDCLLPRWADVLYRLEQAPTVALIVLIEAGLNGLCWLHYQGAARPVSLLDRPELLPAGISPALSHHLYQLIRLTPQRIDLMDERRGWGARETLE